MFTQCPQCDAIFQLSASQLKAANGEVRCGQCLSVFNALNNLSEDIPETPGTETTDELADDANQYRDWNDEASDSASPLNESAIEPDNAGQVATENDDVFSSVIAEASTHEIPAEEIDRFEEFLATDILPEDGLPTTPVEEPPLASAEDSLFVPAEGSLIVHAEDSTTTSVDTASEIPGENAPTTEAFLSADESADETASTEYPQTVGDSLVTEVFPPANIPHHPEDTPPTEYLFAAIESVPHKDTVQVDDFSPAEKDPLVEASSPATTLNAPFSDSFSTSETNIPSDETNFGDIDAITSALDAKISTNDDEFAELDAYLNGAEEEYAQDMSKRIEETTPDADKIIIETADLEPLTSPDYADTLDSLVARTPDETAADNEPQKQDAPTGHETETTSASGDDAQTVNIPSLILDDLHAAKAEQLRPSSTPWVIGSLILMLTLVLQVAYHSRDELAKDASLRPWLIKMCNIANCTLSQPYDIKQIEIIGRDVRSHPTARKSLVVSTTLINNATFVQPYPLLTVLFSDINGTKLAQRRFTPREYLHNSVDLATGMTPDMPVRVELELVDPGKAAINYEFHAEVDPRRTRPLS